MSHRLDGQQDPNMPMSQGDGESGDGESAEGGHPAGRSESPLPTFADVAQKSASRTSPMRNTGTSRVYMIYYVLNSSLTCLLTTNVYSLYNV